MFIKGLRNAASLQNVEPRCSACPISSTEKQGTARILLAQKDTGHF